MRRDLHVNTNMKVAIAITLNVLYAFALQPEHRARLSAGRDFQRSVAVECRDGNIRSEGRLNKINRDFAQKVVAIALKNLVSLDVQDDVKIARRPSAKTGFTAAGRAEARASVHAGWDAEFDLRGALSPP